MAKKNTLEELKVLYEQNNNQFRFFLAWRQLLIAGYFAFFGTVFFAFRWALQHDLSTAFVIPFLGFFVSALFWMLELGNRELFVVASKAGSEIEKQIGDPKLGYYAAYAVTEKMHPKKLIRHKNMLSILYWEGGLLMLAAGLLNLFIDLSIHGGGQYSLQRRRS